MEKLDLLTEKLDPLNDVERLAALDESGLLDSAAEEAFDRLTRLASRLLKAPVALVSLVTPTRQYFKSALGLSEPWATLCETPLSHSFCKHVVLTGKPFIVVDARENPLVSSNLAIRDLGVIAYCGIPIVTSDGFVLGSFAAVDDKPRDWTAADVETLTDLAASVITEIELRARTRQAEQRAAQLKSFHRENLLLQKMQQEAEIAQDRLVAILEETSDYVCTADVEGNITYANMAQRSLYTEQSDGNRHITDYHPDWAIRLLLEEAIPTALETGMWSGETALNHPDGRYIPLSQVLIGHRSPTGDQYISLIGRDISERKNTENALQESEERYRKAIAGAEGAVYEFDVDTNSYTYLDRQIERIMGYSVEEVTPALWGRISLQVRLRGALEGQKFSDVHRQFRAGELDYWTADYQYRTSQGELRWVSDASIPRRDETGHVCGSLGILQDITDRVRTEEELRESEERFRALADSPPVLIWIADATGKTTYFNRQWLRYTGRTLEQELGYGWAEGLYAEDLIPCRQVVTAAWKTRSEYRMEYRLGRAEGTYGWVLETGSPQFAQDGAFLGYIGSCIDIQEQKQALEAVQLSESRLNAAQKMARIGNWEFDPDKKEIRWSAETYRIHGMSPDSPQPTLAEAIALIHPDDRERWKQTVCATALQNGQSYEFEFCILLADGSTRIAQAHGECRRDADGHITTMRGTIQDITERKEAEEERTRLLEILEATPDYVAVTDIKGNLLYLNRTGRDILALAPDEVKAHSIRDRYIPSAASLILNVGMPTAQRDGIWMGETIIQSADGRKIPMLQMIQVHRNAEGEPQFFSTIARDITERKRSEEESLRNLRDAAVREAMAKRNQELQALSRRLVEVQEAERTHIARELHDEIGQNLTGLKLTLGAFPRLGEEGKARNLKLAMDLTTELMGQVRAMSLDLRPGMLDDLGLLPALQWHLDRYTTQTGVCVEFEEEGLRDRRFNRASETAAYRIVQEALTNVARYADTKSARVRVRVVRDKLHLSIVNQGKGFEPEVVLAAGRSNGLAGMRERALLLGGTFGIQSSPELEPA